MPVEKTKGEPVIGSTLNTDGTLVFEAKKLVQKLLLAQIVELVKKLRPVMHRSKN